MTNTLLSYAALYNTTKFHRRLAINAKVISIYRKFNMALGAIMDL